MQKFALLASLVLALFAAAGCGSRVPGNPAAPGGTTPAGAVIVPANAEQLPSRGGGYWEVGFPIAIWNFNETTMAVTDRLTSTGGRVFQVSVGQAWSPGLSTRTEANDMIIYRMYSEHGGQVTAQLISTNPPALKKMEPGRYLVAALVRIDNLSEQMIGSCTLMVIDPTVPFLTVSGFAGSPDTTGQRVVEAEVNNLSHATAHDVRFRAICQTGWGDYSLVLLASDDNTETSTEVAVGGDVEIVPGTLRIGRESRGGPAVNWDDPSDLSTGVMLGDIGQRPTYVRFAVKPKPYITIRVLGNFTQDQDISSVISAEIEVWGYDANDAWSKGAVIPAEFYSHDRKIIGWFNTAPDTVLQFIVKALDQNGNVLYKGESTRSQWWTGDTDVDVAMSTQ